MSFQIRAEKLGVVVMRTDTDVDPAATQTIRDDTRIKVGKVKASYSFRPILQVTISVPRNMRGRLGRDRLIAVARFQYRKNDQSILTYDFIKDLDGKMIFHPTVVPDLNDFRDQLLGWWEVGTGIAIISREKLDAAIENHRRNFLRNLRYTRVASFKWEVVDNNYNDITETGQRRTPPARDQQDATISVDMSNI